MQAILGPRPQPGKWQSAALAAGMHLLLGLFLFYSVRWQSSPPAAVQVDLVRALPAQPARAAAPKPVVEVPKPVQAPRPEPKPVEVPKPVKPDIALKDDKPKPKEKPPEKPVEKPLPKPLPAEKSDRRDTQKDRDHQKLLLEQQLARETSQLTQQKAAREAEEVRARLADAARLRAVDAWIRKIQVHVRRYIRPLPGVVGNPEAQVQVKLLPADASVVGEPQVKVSTGNPALDAAIVRAIFESSPLPKPDDPSVFERELLIKYRPLEQ